MKKISNIYLCFFDSKTKKKEGNKRATLTDSIKAGTRSAKYGLRDNSYVINVQTGPLPPPPQKPRKVSATSAFSTKYLFRESGATLVLTAK